VFGEILFDKRRYNYAIEEFAEFSRRFWRWHLNDLSCTCHQCFVWSSLGVAQSARLVLRDGMPEPGRARFVFVQVHDADEEL
jgi:hypothetical protein